MRRRVLLSTLVADLVALAAGLVVSSQIVFGTAEFWNAPQIPPGESVWPLVSLLVIGLLAASYGSMRMWGTGVPRPSYGRAVAIVFASLLLTSVGISLVRVYWSRPLLAATAGLWLVGALAHRFARRVTNPWRESCVVITGEKVLVEDLHDAPHVDVAGVLDPQGVPPSEPLPPDIELVVDLRAVLSDPMAQFVSSCNLAGISIRSLGNFYESHTGRMPIVHLAEGWELAAPVSRNSDYVAIKRVVDSILVTVTAPLWLLLGGMIALAVRIDSDGPVIFKQERVGRNGRPFTLYKFRTMVEGAERQGPAFTTENDDRLTRVGKVLRKVRIDEIPQLWNVLRGDLSLVGPRPEQRKFVDHFSQTIPFYSYRHLVRPGVTGWAQVNYGYADDEADTVEKLTFDLYYLKHMSPWLDLSILGRSLWTVLSGFGAQ